MTEDKNLHSGSGSPKVGIVMGSDSDLTVMQETGKLLDEFNVGYNITISSAHRSPELTAAFAKNAAQKGFEVIIAGAGGAAHLAGVIASKTTLPVIGVPIDSSSLKGLDALLSTVQMPPGIPVATMAVGCGNLCSSNTCAQVSRAQKEAHAVQKTPCQRHLSKSPPVSPKPQQVICETRNVSHRNARPPKTR